MFDIGASELLVIVIVAVLVIGPKDLPLALRTAGRWIGKVRRVSAHFRTGLDAMVREAEMEDMEEKWREQNARIMAEHPTGEMMPLSSPADKHDNPDAKPTKDGAASGDDVTQAADQSQPDLPLDPPKQD